MRLIEWELKSAQNPFQTEAMKDASVHFERDEKRFIAFDPIILKTVEFQELKGWLRSVDLEDWRGSPALCDIYSPDDMRSAILARQQANEEEKNSLISYKERDRRNVKRVLNSERAKNFLLDLSEKMSSPIIDLFNTPNEESIENIALLASAGFIYVASGILYLTPNGAIFAKDYLVDQVVDTDK